jgi:steroid 5-alpha reductase family enzyme
MDTSLLFRMLAWSLGACSIIMMFVWLWAWRIKNAGVVDIFWSFNFGVIAIILFLMGDDYSLRKLMICGMVLLWSSRLGIYLLIRVGSHLHTEEGRYQQLRKEWAPAANAKFFGFFQMQAFSNVFLAIPFFLICLNRSALFQPLEYVAVCIWTLAVLGESAADNQLKTFKSSFANKGKVCDKGLWNYSRHPNYFFEWMIWISYFLFACASPWGWISIVCPLVILFLILKVTGIPMTEEQSIRSKGEAYKEYQRTTSAFIPWFKKKGSY